jgi:hypothetical protein
MADARQSTEDSPIETLGDERHVIRVEASVRELDAALAAELAQFVEAMAASWAAGAGAVVSVTAGRERADGGVAAAFAPVVEAFAPVVEE